MLLLKRNILKRFYLASLCVGALATFSFASESPKTAKRASRAQTPVEIRVTPVGPTQEIVDRIKAQVEQSAAIQKELRGVKYNLISFEYVFKNTAANRSVAAPEGFRVTFYDYTNDRSILAEGDFAAPQILRIVEDVNKPNPSETEFAAAYKLLGASAEFGTAMKNQKIRAYPAMPPITVTESGERLVNIGLEPLDGVVENEVVGISFKRNAIVRYPDNAPPASSATSSACGIPTAGQGSSGQGVAGQYQLTVSQNGTTLWEMLITRPSASSGPNGSGIDLQNVKYRGKSVMKRGHVPVLNVNYAGDVCGPYLDWQYAEGYFQAPEQGSQNPAPGIRVLAPGQIATTAVETGSDFGNFQGVAIYTQNVGLGPETVMVSEMNAGWYRYIMEWRFANDGTIRPRFGFGAINNSCVCSAHYHHVYWRFDFDIVQPNNRLFQVERGRKFIRPVTTEKADLRNYQTNKSFIVQNANGEEAYILTPNVTDGRWNEGDPSLGAGDFWFLKTAPNNGELGIISGTALNMTPYLNNESIENQDLVVWYAGHFAHSDGENLLNRDRSGLVLTGSHVVGPDIRLIRW